jgi:hypothetical protein
MEERRTRIKRSPALEVVCAQYGTTPKASQVLVSEGRKAIHVLSYGKIDSARCFVACSPTPSFRKGIDRTLWPTIAIPNEWKIVVFIHDDLWIAETKYDPQVLYQFSRLDETGEVAEKTGWFANPSAAFNTRNVSHKPSGPLRFNGKLFVGVHYEIPQAKIREHFTYVTFPESLCPFAESWLQGNSLPDIDIIVRKDTEDRRTDGLLSIFDLYGRLCQKFPSVTIDSVMDAIVHAPYATVDRRIRWEDFIDFIERVEDIWAELVSSVRGGGGDPLENQIFRDSIDLNRLQPFFATIRASSHKRAADFIHLQMRKYLITRGVLNLTGNVKDAIHLITAMPLATEMMTQLQDHEAEQLSRPGQDYQDSVSRTVRSGGMPEALRSSRRAGEQEAVGMV